MALDQLKSILANSQGVANTPNADLDMKSVLLETISSLEAKMRKETPEKTPSHPKEAKCRLKEKKKIEQTSASAQQVTPNYFML